MKVFLLTFIINLSIGLGFSATASVDKNRCTIDDIISFKIEFENEEQDQKILNFADIYRSRTVQKRQNIVVYEISGTSERINKFLDDLDTIGGIKVELVRSGPIGLGI